MIICELITYVYETKRCYKKYYIFVILGQLTYLHTYCSFIYKIYYLSSYVWYVLLLVILYNFRICGIELGLHSLN